MINEAWPLRPLGDLFKIGAGKTMSAAARNGEDKTPFLRTSNVLWDVIDLTTVDEMAIPVHELRGKLLRSGDLLVCEGGEIGRAAIWNGEMEVMSFQNHLHRLRPMADDVDPHFYVYFLQCGFTQLGIFEGAGNKTTIPNLSRNRLAALDVPQPKISEQRDIVRALARVREAMKLHDRSLLLSHDLKRAAMRALFTRGLRGDAQKDTGTGPVPESWEPPTVAESVCPFRFDRAKQIAKSAYRDSGRWPIVDQGQQPIAGYTDEPEKVITPEDPLIIFGDHTRVFKFVDFPFSLGADGTRPLLSGKGFLPKFLFHALTSLDVPARGYNRHYTVLSEMRLPKPSPDEQREIVAILDAIDRKIDLHRRKRAALDDLFKALLHRLMTGEIRVADLDLSALAPKPTAEVAA